MTRLPSTAALLALGAAAMANRAAAEILASEGIGAFLGPELLHVADNAERLIDRTANAPQERPVTPEVAPVAQQPATTPAEPATWPQPATATDAVLIAKAQLGEGVTARQIANWVGERYGLETDAAKVRALLAKARSKGLAPPPVTPPQPQPEPQPEPGTGGYL